MLIKNGKLLLFSEGGFKKQDIRCGETKIKAIATNLSPLKNEEVIDASGTYITPGLIDAHSHICISEEGQGTVGDDCNDYESPLMPYLDSVDAIYPGDSAIALAIAHGVTTACICPGSDSVIGGTCSVINLHGNTVKKMLLRHRAGMKCAFGENPKNAGYSFKSRMGNAYLMRKCIEDTLDYKYEKELAFKSGTYFKKNLGFENMLLVIEKKIPLHAHVHRSDDIYTAIRIAEEYGLKLILLHATDAGSILDVLSKKQYPIVMGPTISPRSKLETQNKSFTTAKLLNNAGIPFCITADHDVTPIYYLTTYAAEIVREGVSELEALRALTATPAKVLGIENLTGSLTSGLQADIVIWNSHPLSHTAKVLSTYIKGERVYPI